MPPTGVSMGIGVTYPLITRSSRQRGRYGANYGRGALPIYDFRPSLVRVFVPLDRVLRGG